MNQFEEQSELPALPGPSPLQATDLVSQNLIRRTLGWAIVLGVGLLIGFGILFIAGDSGSSGWILVSTIAVFLLSLVVIAYNLRRINDMMSWLIVGFFLICWIMIGTPTVAEGQSGGGAKGILISEAGLMGLLLFWGAEIFLRQRADLIKTPLNPAIPLYLLVCVVSTVASILFPNTAAVAYGPKMSVQVNFFEILIRVLALGGLLMIGNKLHGKSLRAGAVAIILPGVLTYTGLIPVIGKGASTVWPQIVAMCLLSAFTLSDVSWLKLWMRIASGAIALSILGVYFLKGTEWVSGWASCLIALAIICWYSNRKLLWAGCAVIAVVVASNPVYFYNKVYAQNFYGKYLKASSERETHGAFDNDRIRMMKAAILYAEHFPLGIGLGNYRSYNRYFGRENVWDTTTFTSAHGTYSQALSETGWLGLLSLLGVIYSSCRMMRQYYLRLPEKSWGKTYMLGGYSACIGIFTMSIIGDYIFPTYHNGGLVSFGPTVYTWFVIGIAIAIGKEYGLRWEEIAGKRQAIASRTPAPVWQREITS